MSQQKTLLDQILHSRFLGFKKQSIFAFFITLIVICILGYYIHCKMNHELVDSLKETATHQVEMLAYGFKQQGIRELDDLKISASLVERGVLSPEALIEVSKTNNINFQTAIVTRDGLIVAGESIPSEALSDLWESFHGAPVMKYNQRYGLISAVPIQINGESDALCRIYDSESLRHIFGMFNYNGNATVTVVANENNWLVIDRGESYLEPSPNVAAVFKDLLEQMKINGHAVSYAELNDDAYFFYGVYSFDRSYAVTGYVPLSAIAVGLEYLHVPFLIVNCLLIFTVVLYIRYFLRTRQAEKFKQEKILADEANKAKSEFLSNMSHEIRTPINAVLGMDEMILRECKDETILEYAENIRISGNSLLGLVNDILDFSKIEAGKMEIIPVEYHLSSVLNDLLNMIRPRADKKNLTVEVKCSPDIPSILFGDEIRIKQVVTNILTNAVKYTETGGVTMNVDFYRKTDDPQKIMLQISIADTGIGIKEEDLSKLFSAFERIEEKRNRTIEGTGLGMNITQRLLGMMNSKLNVESIYGEGSIFSFELEQRIVCEEPIGDFEEAFKRSLAQHKTYHQKFIAPDAKILVVDDTPMNLTVVKGLLKQTRVQIDTAESGLQCLELIREKDYDLIFLDHRMPEMDGIETLRKMLEIWNGREDIPPVISLTANAISGAREMYIAAGFKDYLTKPINSSQLESMMIRYLPKEKVTIEESTEETVDENLPMFEGIDSKIGVENCGSSEDFLNALKVFANSIESNSGEIERYFESQDWKNYTTKVHALKSTARIIGATELSDRARRLEDAGNSSYIDEIRKDNPALLELYRSYLKKLSALIEVEDDESKPLIDSAQLAEAYQTLKEVSASFDYDTASFVMNSLADYRLPESERERYKDLKNAVEKLDWETVNRLIA